VTEASGKGSLYGTLSIPLGVQAQRFRTDSGFAFESSAWLKPRVGFASMSMNSSGMCFRHFLFATIVARADFFRRGEACHISIAGDPSYLCTPLPATELPIRSW